MKNIYVCDGVNSGNVLELKYIFCLYSATNNQDIISRLIKCVYGEKDRDGLIQDVFVCSVPEDKTNHLQQHLNKLGVETRVEK